VKNQGGGRNGQKKLGRREKNELKNREMRYLPARSSALNLMNRKLFTLTE